MVGCDSHTLHVEKFIDAFEIDDDRECQYHWILEDGKTFGFFKRLRFAWGYIFNLDGWCDYDDVHIIDESMMKRLCGVLSKLIGQYELDWDADIKCDEYTIFVKDKAGFIIKIGDPALIIRRKVDEPDLYHISCELGERKSLWDRLDAFKDYVFGGNMRYYLNTHGCYLTPQEMQYLVEKIKEDLKQIGGK